MQPPAPHPGKQHSDKPMVAATDSYKEHMRQRGYSENSILGHKSLKTTEIYTHPSARTLQGVKNPLDSMNFQL